MYTLGRFAGARQPAAAAAGGTSGTLGSARRSQTLAPGGGQVRIIGRGPPCTHLWLDSYSCMPFCMLITALFPETPRSCCHLLLPLPTPQVDFEYDPMQHPTGPEAAVDTPPPLRRPGFKPVTNDNQGAPARAVLHLWCCGEETQGPASWGECSGVAACAAAVCSLQFEELRCSAHPTNPHTPLPSISPVPPPLRLHRQVRPDVDGQADVPEEQLLGVPLCG